MSYSSLKSQDFVLALSVEQSLRQISDIFLAVGMDRPALFLPLLLLSGSNCLESVILSEEKGRLSGPH